MKAMSNVIKETMTLKEITDLLGDNVRHNDAMKIVGKMATNPDFGLTRKTFLERINNLGFQVKDETYQLDKRQSIAVAAKLNTSIFVMATLHGDQYKRFSFIACILLISIMTIISTCCFPSSVITDVIIIIPCFILFSYYNKIMARYWIASNMTKQVANDSCCQLLKSQTSLEV